MRARFVVLVGSVAATGLGLGTIADAAPQQRGMTMGLRIKREVR